MSYELAIAIENLSKCFNVYKSPLARLANIVFPKYFKPSVEFWALRDVSLKIERGETLGVIGRNGSGKSTLLQIICGTLTQTSGAVQTSGKVAALLELGAGFNPEFTGIENVYLAAALYGLGKDETDKKIDSIVDFSGIGQYIQQPVKTYSSGMFVRLAFSVIAHVDADILIIDEALAVGDAQFTQKCMRFLKEYQKIGTLIFVSHDLSAVKNMCKRAVWLEFGRVKMLGTAKDVAEKYLADIYLQDESLLDSKPLVQVEAQNSNGNSEKFGTGYASILNVEINRRSDNSVLKVVYGREAVSVHISAVAYKEIKSPILGFFIKDRLGQHLFGENTLGVADHSVFIAAGKVFSGRFDFEMPILPPGEYSIAAAIAEGDQISNVQHEWVHDAYQFTSAAPDDKNGIVGIKIKPNISF